MRVYHVGVVFRHGEWKRDITRMSTLGNVQVEHMKVEHEVEHRSGTGRARANSMSALVSRAVTTPAQLKTSRSKVVPDLCTTLKSRARLPGI